MYVPVHTARARWRGPGTLDVLVGVHVFVAVSSMPPVFVFSAPVLPLQTIILALVQTAT